MMKVCFVMLLLFATSVSFASPVSVTHTHNGRLHTHVLPAEGIAHSHGGSVGQAVPKVVKKTGTLVYGGNKQAVKPDYYDFSSSRHQPAVVTNADSSVLHSHGGRKHSHSLPAQGVAHRHGRGPLGSRVSANIRSNHSSNQSQSENNGLVFSPSNTAQHTPMRSMGHTMSAINGSNSHYNRRNVVKGDISCRAGQSNCNVCAANVQQQFKRAAANQIRWKTKPWSFAWPQTYPPHNLRPLDIFNGSPAHALGIPRSHIQGFVRTNSALYPYAGSHSHKKQGGIFVVKQGSDGKKFLSTLHRTKGRHPSGVHIIGKYLVYGLGNRLYFKDMNSRNQEDEFSLPVSKANFGGGLGIVKLADNRHLVVTTGPGGQKSRPRFNRFYMLKTVNGRPSSLKLVNESSVKKPSQWPRGFAFSENLSLITECGTGDIYAVHTTGDEKGISAIRGNGYWKLSKLVQHGSKLDLSPVNAFMSRQNMTNCNMRAAATVGVTPQKRLEFSCHGYAKDPDGSGFNVLGHSSRNKDKFYFRTGTVF